METSTTRSCPTRAFAALALVLLAAAAVYARRRRGAHTEDEAVAAPAEPVVSTPVRPHDPVGLGMD